MRRVYFDHSATTAADPEVAAAIVETMINNFGNPSSVHAFGREARKVVDGARVKVASLLGAKPEEIYFTSGGTESDNLAIKGIAYANRSKGNHIITTAIEHHAILHTCELLEKQGFEVTYLPVDETGRIQIDQLKSAITNRTILISVMYANNEVGTLQPIAEIGKLAKERGIYFHTDAVQAVGQVPIDVHQANIDMLTLSAHKFHGPKGVGAIYIRRGVCIEAIQQGGSQERLLRAGTENVPGIVGLAKASELAEKGMKQKSIHLSRLREKLYQGIMNTIPDVKYNGHPTEHLPGLLNVSIKYVEGESLLLNLDLKGIAASSGSACTSGSLDPSHVLLAMGLSHEIAHGSLRISLGKMNTDEDIDYMLEVLPEIVARLRSMSPLAAVR